MTQEQHDALIIGAGHNGLVTAAYLAIAGLSVLVLERLDKVGGACTTDEIFPGFFGPMCAYNAYVLQGKVVDDLQLREYGFEIARRPGNGGQSIYLHPFPDGTFFGGPGGRNGLDMGEQIRGFSEHDSRSYLGWQSFWDRASSLLHSYFLTEPPTLAEVFARVRDTSDEQVLEKMLTVSLMDLLNDFFEDDHVKAHFIGLTETDPSAPGSVMSAAYSEASRFSRPEDRGIPRGSMGALSNAMAESARDFGAEIRTGGAVSQIIIESGEAVGVRLAGGEEIRSSIVVSNADPKHTYGALVSEGELDAPFLRKVRNTKSQSGSLKFLAALKELPDFSRYLGPDYERESITRVTVCPSVEWFQQDWDDCESGRPTMHPLMHIQIPSTVDPSLTPRGGHIMSNWIQFASPWLAEGTWDSARQQVGENIIDILNEYAPNFRSSIIDWTLQTPADMETRVGITDGNFRHGDVIPNQMFSQRFSHSSPVKNLYLCGAGTHPGGDVSGAPGHNAAHLILKERAGAAV